MGDPIDTTTGHAMQPKSTNGAAHVSLPQNSSGTLLVGEHASGTSNPTNTTVNFATGLNGVVLDYNSLNQATGLPDNAANDASMVAYVAFGNTAFNDVTVAGMRWVIPIGKSRTFSFENVSPKPNSMTISIPDDGVNDPLSMVFYAAVQE